MTRSSLILLALAACGSRDEQIANVAPAQPVAPTIDPIVKGIPHGGQITHVAVTEQADAALTFDTVGGVRLWPALDGSRTPVPLSVVAPAELALAHAGNDLLAAVLDEAGAIDLMRLGRDGSLRGRTQLPADVAYEQVLAIDEGVLTRSADQAIEWFSPDGESRGKLVAEPARRIRAIAARHGRAVAIVSDGTKDELRWVLTLGGSLIWGAAVPLPAPVKNDLIALSPSHRRLAMIDATGTMSVYDIAFVPTKIGTSVFASDAEDLGFIDEDRVAVMGNTLQWWSMPHKPASTDPWAVTSTSMPVPKVNHLNEGGAIADNLVVTGFGASLALSNSFSVEYLGYQAHGVGNVGATASSLWVSMSSSHVVWLDDKLAIQREVELRKDPNGPWMHATPIGAHHVVTQSPRDGKYIVQLVDVDRLEQPVTIGSYASVDRVDFAPDSGLLGVAAVGKVHRFKLDLATNAVTKLGSFRASGSLMSLRLLDPARADGVTAVSVGWDGEYDEHYTLTIYRDKGKKQRIKPFRGTLIDIDPAGTMYTYETDKIVVRRGAKKVSTIAVKGIESATAVNADASRFAIRDLNDVVVFDATGSEKWRKTVWGTAQLVFTKDGKHLVVRGLGGLVLLAAETGERVALECGWSFGVMKTPPISNTLAFAPVCEDPTL